VLKPWHLILFGIGLTIVAALMQHISIAQKFAQLEEIESKLTNLDGRIDSLWQQHVEAERKKEFAALISSDTNRNNADAQAVLEHYLNSLQPDQKMSHHQDAIKAITHHQEALRDQIDDLYFKHLEQSKARRPLQRDIDNTRNIALLLQLLGLILVLSKDLAKRD